MKTNKSFAGLVLFTFGAGMSHSWGQVLTTPVYMQDTPSDTGVEPNPESPRILVATVKSQPYRATIKDLKPGHYMVWVIAVNDRGGSTQSFPGHIAVNERK